MPLISFQVEILPCPSYPYALACAIRKNDNDEALACLSLLEYVRSYSACCSRLEGSTSFVFGRRGQALQICNVNDSYLITRGTIHLGRNDQSYSFSIWINPAVIQKSTIIHMSSHADGSDWSVPIIGMDNAGQLTTLSWEDANFVNVTGPFVSANNWTHVVSTYSLNNGLRLYVNGNLYSSSLPFLYRGSGELNYLLVGSSRAFLSSPWWLEIVGQYSGAVDELQVYSRELTTYEVNRLANPVP